jgi:hypothetical protein
MVKGQRVKVTGFPHKFAGYEGTVERRSELFESVLVVRLDTGDVILTEDTNLQEIDYDESDPVN